MLDWPTMAEHGFSVAAAALPLGILALLCGCATRKIAPQAVPPEPAPRAIVEIGAAIGLDQYRSRLPFTLRLENPGGRALDLESAACVLEVEGAEAGRVEASEGASIEAGGAAAITLEFLVDSRKLGDAISGGGGPARASFRIEAAAFLRDSGGARIAARARAEGSFPIVREPELRILALRIERDILVTTNLRLEIEVRNPNAFPIRLGSLEYDFYGEGRPWSGGRDERPLLVPAGSSARLALAFELNFADRDRALFDLVANLRIVRYRLAGTGSVATDLDYLPEFPLRFDEEGSCQVER
jgi:LEA14-like dessication related protein